MSASEARLRANSKYHQKFERIQIRVQPEEKDMIDSHAEKMRESTNAFVRRAIAEAMERDNANASQE